MNNRLTQAQLTKLVGEVERLSQARQDELEPEQVKEILRELSLPPELLDEAMIQLRRREALSVQQQRRRWLVGGIAASVILVASGIIFSLQQNQQALSRVAAQQDRVTLVQDSGSTLTTVARQTNPELFYRITLKDAPIGKKLSLSCSWIDPTGQVVKQNRYQTRQIDTPVWNTQCRYQLGTAAPTGKWQVRLLLNDRPLSDATFEVK